MLPFANMSGDPEQEYFADGMVDDILMALSRVRWLFVIARQSSFIYKVRVADVQQIGRELGVRYVVEGSVRKSGNRVRIVAQLIETETGAHIWADRYEGDLRDIFALQDEITERIVSAVEVERPGRRDQAHARQADGQPDRLRPLPARAAGLLRANRGRLQGAPRLLGQALEQDPEYAEALGTLTDCVAVRTLHGWHESWAGGVDESCRLADRALAAGPDNSTCLASAAFTYGVLSHRFEEALELANRAVMLHPNSVLVRYRAGAVYVVCGESDKAIAQCEAACRMNPLDSRKAATATFSTLVGRAVLRRPLRGVHPRRQACTGFRAAGQTSPASTSPRRLPSSAAPARRGPRSPSSSSTSPMLRSHSSGNKASATSGCTSCIWRACARLGCPKGKS